MLVYFLRPELSNPIKVDAATPSLVGLISQSHEIIVSHGNGPQVGAISLAFEVASQHTDRVPRMELPECTAMSQGYIGYHLQQGIAKELRRVGMPWHVASVVTQVEVAADDPAFTDPSKPIGGFYDDAEARAMMAARPGLVMVEDSGRGWRTVIACGGGGIPVVKDAAGDYYGVPAVIDKDFASSKLAEVVGADFLFILTAVDRVAIGFGTPDQRDLVDLDLVTAQRYVDDGCFGAGSMLPKVQAAMELAASGPGRTAVICSLEKAPLAMRGESGTVIHG